MLPNVRMGICDVRTVALAHIEALTNLAAVNNRHLVISTKNETIRDMATWINEDFKENISTTLMPNFLLRFGALFMDELKLVVEGLGKDIRFEDSRLKQALKIEPISSRQAVHDMVVDIKRKKLA